MNQAAIDRFNNQLAAARESDEKASAIVPDDRPSIGAPTGNEPAFSKTEWYQEYWRLRAKASDTERYPLGLPFAEGARLEQLENRVQREMFIWQNRKKGYSYAAIAAVLALRGRGGDFDNAMSAMFTTGVAVARRGPVGQPRVAAKPNARTQKKRTEPDPIEVFEGEGGALPSGSQMASTPRPRPPTLSPGQLVRQRFLRRAKLGGELGSAKNEHLFENRGLTVQQYITRFRKGRIKEVLPSEASGMTVEQALRTGRVGGVNVRKLILDTRDKFVK